MTDEMPTPRLLFGLSEPLPYEPFPSSLTITDDDRIAMGWKRVKPKPDRRYNPDYVLCRICGDFSAYYHQRTCIPNNTPQLTPPWEQK